MENYKNLLTFGWREWAYLPELELPAIKAKVDTGARTSSLHAFELHLFMSHGVQKIKFHIHPKQQNEDIVVICTADVLDKRLVRDSGGHQEERWVIKTPVRIGNHTWPIELTLTSRDSMRFRMLLGRSALKNRAIVDSALSYCVGQNPKKLKSS